MKTIKKFSAIVVFLLFTMGTISLRAKAQVQFAVSFQFFYDNLSPYGTWVDYPEYGYVWQPDAEQGFCPYRTRGHWVWSYEYEWIWVSDYDWGWATFHYGRWHYDRYYGWLWIPDYYWAPAWVIWRSGGDYYGWAPLDAGISISISFNNYSPPYNYWCFVPRRYIASPDIYNYYVSPQQNVTIINNTTVINNYNTNGGPTGNVFVNGPQLTEVEQYTQQKISSVKLHESSTPGRTEIKNNEMIVYKPKVNAADKSSARPSKVTPLENLKKVGGNVNEPVKNEPVRNEPVRNEPVKNEPVRNEPVKNEPVRNEPVKNEPVRNEPVKNQPVKNEPVRNEPVKNQPVRNEPVKNEPVRNEPVKNEPVKNEPVKNEPVRNEPVKNEPVKNEPVKNEPVRNEPVKNEPVRNEPVKNQPVKNEPVRNEPVKSQPVKNQPVKNEPVKKGPAKNQPAKKDTTRNG
jgi:Family of unknown function (DUF6600)